MYDRRKGPQNPRIVSDSEKLLTPKKMIKWVNGVPVPHTEWILPPSALNDVLMAALCLPYTGTLDPYTQQVTFEPEYVGLTNIEVAGIKQARKAAEGDLESLKFCMERLLGKPKQQVEQTTINVSLTDYIKNIEGEIHRKAEEWEKKTIDVNPQPEFDI